MPYLKDFRVRSAKPKRAAKGKRRGEISKHCGEIVRTEIADSGVPGLFLVIQPSGVKSWAVRTRLFGKPIKMTLGRAGIISLKDARDRAKAACLTASEGRDPREAKRIARAQAAVSVQPETNPEGESSEITLTDAAAAFKAFPTVRAAALLYRVAHVSTLRRNSQVNTNRELAFMVKHWGNRPLVTIGKRDVIAMLDAAAGRGNSPSITLRRFSGHSWLSAPTAT